MVGGAKRKAAAPTVGRIRARNRALILRAAQEVFAKKGFDGTTIAEIAKGSGLPKANIYYYFGSKKGVYRAVIAALLSEWNAAFEHIAAGREPDKAIKAYVRAKLDFSRRNMSASKIFANENVRGAAFLSPQELKSIRSITREKAKVIESWIKANKLGPVDPVHLFIMLWAATQFYADFNAVVCNVLGVKRLTRTHFDDAAACITAVTLHGLEHRRRRKKTRRPRT